MADARDAARRTLRRIAGGAFGSRALDAELARVDAPADRALATELVYGVLRHRTRLDRALAAATAKGKLSVPPPVLDAMRVAAYQLVMLDRVPAHAAVDDAVSAVRRAGGARLAGFVNGALRRLARDGEPSLGDAPVEVAYSLPAWIARELAAATDDVAAAAAGLCEPAPLCARANALRATPERVAELLRGEGADVELAGGAAVYVRGLGDVTRSASFRDGLWTVQDLGAQRVGELAAPRAGLRVLDACAGVGGKSTHLAELAGDRAEIDAADLSPAKLDKLRATAERLGVTCVRPIAADLTDPDAPLADAYDLIVLDAPCSGLGVLRRHPERKWQAEPDVVDRMAALQRRLLGALIGRLRPGGALVYAVCTFTRREGEDQMAAFAAAHPELKVVRELRTWPHRDGADAFYAARVEWV